MKTLTSILLFGAAIGCCAQVLVPSKHQPLAGSISHVQAAIKAKAFHALLVSDAGNATTYKVVLAKRPGRKGEQVWHVYTPTARVSVQAKTGDITFFTNTRRRDDRYRNRGRTGEKFTTSEAVAKAHIRALATKLGVPTTVKQATFNMVGDGVGQDSNPLGHFGSVFKNDAGQIVATLSCDLQDGVVLSYSRSREK